MSLLSNVDAIRMRLSLSGGPLSGRELAQMLDVSQPTLSRALVQPGDDILRIGAARSIQYVLRDRTRGFPDIPIYRVNTEGRIRQLGTLVSAGSDGFVMRQENRVAVYSAGLPWWLFDMRPQGYLGRAYAVHHGMELGLPERVSDWSDAHALRALLVHGHDVVGNLLLGDRARDRFLADALPAPILEDEKPVQYARLARQAAQGETPGSSAGGEQPKFTAFAMTSTGPRHVIVKFSELEDGPVSERWRDLLLAEHLALDTLQSAGINAARTRIVDFNGQRFLEVERFDRVGSLGRSGLFSLAALDAEFVGAGSSSWPIIVRRLTIDGHIHPAAADGADLLWAFGSLIGNSDMHTGNLSFVSAEGRPYDLAPAYDMTPMTFAPRSGGGLRDTIAEANIQASVSHNTWRQAEELARAFLARIKAASGFSDRFEACIVALENHIATAAAKIDRLG